MNYLERSQNEEALLGVLRVHFSYPEEEELAEHAQDMISLLSTALSMEELERSDRRPGKDKESIEAASKALNRAIKHLNDVGRHGSKTFVDVLKSTFDDPRAIGFRFPDMGSHAKEVLVTHLERIAGAVGEASEQVNLAGMSINSAFGDGPEFEKYRDTKPTKTAAHLLAKECARVFHISTGREPTVSTRRELKEPYGPFFDFVTEVFHVLDIEASAEGWAKRACKEFTPK